MRPPAPINLLAIIFLCLSCFPVWAQKNAPAFRSSISGSVRDAATHRPLERVVVMVESEDSGYSGQAQTASSGKFGLQGIPASVYVVRVRLPGYEESSQRVDLTVPSSNYLSFELRPKPDHTSPAIAPEGPGARINARLAAVPEKARKEFTKAHKIWEEGKDPQSSIAHLKKAITIYPRFADAYVLLATVYIQQSKPADARSALDQAIEFDPRLPEARFTLGSLQNSEKDYADAEKSLTEGLKLDEESPQGHYELAKTYWAMGRWQDAEPHAMKAAALQPAMAPVHVILGNIALRKRDPQTALKEFQQYLKLDPKGPMAGGAQSMVDKIQPALNIPQ